MRRLPHLLLLGGLALAATGFGPAPTALPQVDAVDTAQAEQIVVCVKFREWTVPGTNITYEPEYERFCIETRDVPGQHE